MPSSWPRLGPRSGTGLGPGGFLVVNFGELRPDMAGWFFGTEKIVRPDLFQRKMDQNINISLYSTSS